MKYNINLNPTNFVGVKQPNPQYSLDVNGSIRASQYYDFYGNLLTWGTGDTGHTGYAGHTGSTGATGATGNGFITGTNYGNILYWDGTTYTLSNENIAIGKNIYTRDGGDNFQTVSIGYNVGSLYSNNAIAIGVNAGNINQVSNSIILNASTSSVNSFNAGCYISPIRTSTQTNNILVYDASTKYRKNWSDRSYRVNGFYWKYWMHRRYGFYWMHWPRRTDWSRRADWPKRK
jgi:hypothetical protein